MDLSALSTSLPGTSSIESLLDEFKNAALSVTTLYKAANKAVSTSRSAGYQECLADLLQLLDEGTSPDQIRNWALERLCDGNEAGIRRPKPSASAAQAGNVNSGTEEARNVAVGSGNAGIGMMGEERDSRTALPHLAPQHSMDMSEDSDPEPSSIPPSSPIQEHHHNHHGHVNPLNSFGSSSSSASASQQLQPPSTPTPFPRNSTFSFRSDIRAPRHPPPPTDPNFLLANNGTGPSLNNHMRTKPSGAMPAGGAGGSPASVAGMKRRVPYDFFEMAAASAERSERGGKRGRTG